MDPPSETHGVERDELVRQLNEDTDARARVATPSHTPGQGLFGSTLRAHTAGHVRVDLDAEARRYTRQPHEDPDQHVSDDAGRVGLFQGALDNTVRAQPVAAQQAAATTRPPPAPVGGRVAPEAWRDEVRRMVERAPSKGPGPSAPNVPSAPSSQQPGGLGGPSAPGGAGGPGIPGSFKPSLRLKLDADAVEEAVYRAPKSALPKVLVWLVILGLIGGGLVLFADPKGIAGLLKRFGGPEPTLTTQDPQPPAAAAPSAPTVDPNAVQQPPAAAAPAAAAAPTQPAAANAQPAVAPAQPNAAAPQVTQPTAPPPAAAQAKPEAPKTAEPKTAEPKTAEPKTAEPKTAEPKAAEPAAKPAAPVAKPAAPKPARPVRPQQPVVKVRPIESAPSAPAASPTDTAPPTPDHPDIPYVPMPGDPPAPDEPR